MSPELVEAAMMIAALVGFVGGYALATWPRRTVCTDTNPQRRHQ